MAAEIVLDEREEWPPEMSLAALRETAEVAGDRPAHSADTQCRERVKLLDRRVKNATDGLEDDVDVELVRQQAVRDVHAELLETKPELVLPEEDLAARREAEERIAEEEAARAKAEDEIRALLAQMDAERGSHRRRRRGR